MPRTEKVIVANFYGGGNKQGDRLRRWLSFIGFHVVLISELGHLIDELEKIGKVYYNRKESRPYDVGILVSSSVMNRSARAISWMGGKLTPFVRRKGPAKRLWRDRWFVRVRIWGRVYYSIHANAAITGPKGNWVHNKGAAVWKEALRELQGMIREDIKKGLRVRVGGDFNMIESDAENAPNDFFEELGMRHVHDRVMWFGWNPDTDRLVEHRVLGIAPGADAHNVLVVKLRRIRRKRNRKNRR